MTKTSLFLKNFTLLLIGLCLASACSNSQQAPVAKSGAGTGGSSGEGSGKPGLAPSFEESQFQKNQWIQWKGKSANGDIECVRWQWTNMYAEGIKLECRVYKNCVDAETYRVEHILFDPSSGLVIENYYKMADGTIIQGNQKGSSLFAYIYGNPKQEKEIFTAKSLSLAEYKYAAFQRQKQSGFYYLNQPGKAFHAVVIAWTVIKNGVTWNYELNQSEPRIEPLPPEAVSLSSAY